MIEFKITPGGNRPIYQQVVDQVRAAIVSGELSIGDPLPSVRGLAQQLVVNHNTVAKAFAELVRDGTLESR
ncbi:MAG: GntR family transcriptional regulator, partial [Planctomycetales bacterium]|nr:GntR family transcriptional regulator [Planctomycetales bacterium]